MDNYDMKKSARFPDIYYYGIRPTVSNIVAEMDDMSVAYPTQGMYDSMLNRVYDQVLKMYPDDFQSHNVKTADQNPGNPEYHAEQFFPPFRRRPLVRDLLGVLILLELLDRRRHYR